MMAAVATAAALAVAGSAIREWRNDPVRFVRDVFGATPDAWQAKVLRDDAPKVAQRASVGVGKSTGLCWKSWHFLVTRPDPKVVATSITEKNIDDGLWAEMKKWQNKSPLLTAAFQWSADRIYLRERPETWFASKRTWSRTANAEQQGESLAGIHADNVLFILDEAGGIPDAVAKTAENALSAGKYLRLWIAGNPTRLSGPLWRACNSERRFWSVHEISGDPDRADRAPRVSIAWAREEIEKDGRDSNSVRIRVLGEFPTSDTNALLGPDDVLRAMRRNPRREVYADSPRIHAVDVARGGADRSVIVERQGVLMVQPRILRDLVPHGLMTLAGHAAQLYEDRKPDGLFVDETGLGSGVVDRLKQLKVPVVGVNFASASREPKKYRNKRAEIHFALAQWVKQVGALPEIPELVAELTAPQYYVDGQGRFELEDKDEIKKRLGFSPDIADAGALTFSEPVLARTVRDSDEMKFVMAARQSGAQSWDYNPLAVGRG